MKLFKFLLALVALVFLAWGAFALLGLLVGIVGALVKWAVILGVLALAGVGAYKLLAAPDREALPELPTGEAEMLKVERMLAEMKRRQLTK